MYSIQESGHGTQFYGKAGEYHQFEPYKFLSAISLALV